MNWIFVAITFLSLFGSSSRFTPNTPWVDISYFFRKNKKEYLKFSNIFRGNYFLILGLVSLAFFLLSLFIPFKINANYIFIFFLLYIFVAESVLQIKWSNHLKHTNAMLS